MLAIYFIAFHIVFLIRSTVLLLEYKSTKRKRHFSSSLPTSAEVHMTYGHSLNHGNFVRPKNYIFVFLFRVCVKRIYVRQQRRNTRRISHLFSRTRVVLWYYCRNHIGFCLCMILVHLPSVRSYTKYDLSEAHKIRSNSSSSSSNTELGRVSRECYRK